MRRVARQLEADRKATLSRAPRLLRELYETLCIMGGSMSAHENELAQAATLDIEFDGATDINVGTALPSRQSSALADFERDEARSITLLVPHAKSLALNLAQHVKERLGHV
ncbi:hypothetical protein FGB62_61g171 [Gracilaria domingensis]|nr:hypothetical protein FGB62_61g171 [Gracilaria domingensis]